MGSDVTMAIDPAIATKAAAGLRLAAADLSALAAVDDMLALGALADEVRRTRSGHEATFARVLIVPIAAPVQGTLDVPPGAAEVRVAGVADTWPETLAAIEAARRAAGSRVLSGCSLADIVTRTGAAPASLGARLRELRSAGLDEVAWTPVDRLDDLVGSVRTALDAGLRISRVTIQRPVRREDRVEVLLRVRDLQDSIGTLRAFAPLPVELADGVPTTGYDDVRAVALARLALDNVPSIQVDWMLYGPKLAQVALAFGADDLDAVPAHDEESQGRRRAPVAEVQRNIEAAGLQPVERDGAFARRNR
jgi:hypothetical protein